MIDRKDDPCYEYCTNGWISRFWDRMVTQYFMDAYDPFLACISLSSVSYYFCMTSLSRKEE